MRSLRTRARLLAAATIFVVASTACVFDRGPAAGVKPPPEADSSLTARAGVIVATNTPSFRRLIGSARENGIVVLFVQDRGPGDRAGLERGDVITEIDGDVTTNAEHGVVQLRSEDGARRQLTVIKPNGDSETVTVQARVPGRVNLVDIYSGLIDEDPDDAVLRYLRAQARPTSDFDETLDDLDRALEIDGDFAEALILRAERRWTRSRDASLSNDERETQTREALSDWRDALEIEENNTRALANVAQASVLLNQIPSAKNFAQKALKIDVRLPTAHYALGLTELSERHDAEAADAARRAIELNPFDVRFYELLGRIFKRLDRVDDCQKTVEAILGLINSSRDRARLLRTCI